MTGNLGPDRESGVARVPFMITRKMRAVLCERGYSEADIEQLTPGQAHTILGNGAEPAPTPITAEITVFKKRGGPLSKHLELINGKVANDSSQCAISDGTAYRVEIDLGDMRGLADLINNSGPSDAYSTGRMKAGVPKKARIVLDWKLANFSGRPDVISRSRKFFEFPDGNPGIAFVDHDRKGMHDDQRQRIDELGGVWEVLCTIIPALADTAHVIRRSTSFGLRNKETGQTFPDSGGEHIDLAVGDSGDMKRFMYDLHDHAWLTGWGWGVVSAAGSFLERSIVDKIAGSSPERLIIEAPAVIVPPLEQKPRLAKAFEGGILDTHLSCPPLSDEQNAEVEKLKAAERLRLKPACEAQRKVWSAGHVKRLVAKGVSEAKARAQVEHWLDHQELTDAFELPFDDPSLFGATVNDVLANPSKFVGQTMSDPFEGPAYGRGKAVLFQRKNGTLFVNSFAHGGARYELATTPIVLHVGKTEQVVNEIERRLVASNRGLYQRGGVIVCTGSAKMPTADGGEVITQIIASRGDYALVEDAEAVAKFIKFNAKGEAKQCPPPLWLIYTLKDRGHRLRFPVLVGIVNCPSVAADGQLLDAPGYDPKTGVLFDPLGVEFPRVPDRPSRQQAEKALRRLERLIATFDFVSDDDKAVALSLFLTIIARRGLAFAPLHGFDAPVAGSGKSKLVDIASILATGHEAGVVTLGKSQEEAQKVLSSMLMRGDPLIAIDNLDIPLEGALLNQALTQTQVELRVLGQSKIVTARTTALMTATGNNLVVLGDTTRRGVVGRLDPKVERPELRSFTYDPIADAKENRGELVQAALTILKAYHSAGRPNRPTPLQSFTDWSNTVRAALLWLGRGDPVKTMQRLRSTDPTITNLRAFLTAWREQFRNKAATAATAIAKADELAAPFPVNGRLDERYAHPLFRAALLQVAGRSGRIEVRALGAYLSKSADRVIDIGADSKPDLVALEAGSTLHGNRRWRVVSKGGQHA